MNEKNDESDPFEVSTSFPEPPSFDSIGLPAARPGPVFPPNTAAESSVPSDEPAPAPGGEPATAEPPPESDPTVRRGPGDEEPGPDPADPVDPTTPDPPLSYWDRWSRAFEASRTEANQITTAYTFMGLLLLWFILGAFGVFR